MPPPSPVTIFGVSRFLGPALVGRLGKLGCQLVIPYRGNRYEQEKLRVAAGLGRIFYTPFNLKDEKSLYEAMRYSNVVINLIGKYNETKNFSFNEVHVEGPRRMARIAREIGVKKFIHISAINAHPNPEPQCLKNGSRYLQSKYYGELAVREEFPEAIIFRPADMLGELDNFLNHFTDLQRSGYRLNLPLWDYYRGVIKQPVSVTNVVDGIERALSSDLANGKTFQAVGPHRYEFNDLVTYMRSCIGKGPQHDCHITNLRWNIILRTSISVVERLQKYPFLCWERIECDLTSDHVDPKLPTLLDLGVELSPLELLIKTLAYYRPREHRVDIPYEAAEKINLPRRLDFIS